MKSEKKVFLERADGLEAAVDKIIHAPTASIILNIPKNSILGLSPNNFRVMKRESETARKTLLVESIDDHILELAAVAKITAINPVFKTRERTMSDILPRTKSVSRSPSVRTPKDEEVSEKRFWGAREKSEDRMSSAMKITEEVSDEDDAPRKDASRAIDIPIEAPLPRRRKRARGMSIAFSIFVAVAVIGGAYMYFIAPVAQIELVLKKRTVPVELTIDIRKAYHEVADQGNTLRIPGELLTARSNITEEFPAKGRENVSTKAHGTLRIYNAFGSNPQSLVATTRFESPDGKIFRIKSAVIVPGSKVEGGKVIPSHIDADVIADQPGTEYNIQGEGRWTIPGFKGSAKFPGFYAEAAGPMTGGFSGERPTASPEDLATAEKDTERMLRDALESKMLLSQTAGKFSILEGSTQFVVVRRDIPVPVAENEKFGVFMEGEMKQLVFEEQALADAIAAFAGKGSEGEKVSAFDVAYGTPSFDFSEGSITFTATGSVTFEADIDLEAFKTGILGADEASVREAMWMLPGIDSAKASFWPFWVHNAPRNPSKVEVTVK